MIVNKILSKTVCRIRLVRNILDVVERFNNRHVDIYKGNTIKGWSFVIVTDGQSNDALSQCLKSILDENLRENYEIIVVGQNSNIPIINEHINYIKYHSIFCLPGWITYKKNIGAELSKYDKIVFMHDYITLCEGWESGYNNMPEHFDVCTNKIHYVDGRRARDWTVYDYPNIGQALVPYSQNISEYWYCSGAYFICNKQFYLRNPLNEKLRWGEAEDVEWARRIRKNAIIIFNPNSTCKFVKLKPINEAPYCDNWISQTILLYRKFGIELNNDNYVSLVKEI